LTNDTYTNQFRLEFRYLCGWFPAKKKKELVGYGRILFAHVCE